MIADNAGVEVVPETDNRLAVVRYLIGRGLAPKAWERLPIRMGKGGWPRPEANKIAGLVVLRWDDRNTDRIRWAERWYSPIAEDRRGWRRWIRAKRIEIPGWDADMHRRARVRKDPDE